MYEISVIVPVYNVQKWLPRCVESLINQSIFSKIEILLVDDGSSDSSGIICDNYASQYDNIISFHKQNGGVSSARNCALDHARGKFIAFVDSDDCIAPNYYEKLIDSANQYQVDLVVGDYYLLFEDGRKSRYRSSNIQSRLWDRESAIRAFLRGDNIGVNIFDKLFIKDKIGAIRFDEKIRIGEDLLFIFQYLTRVENVYGDFTPGYFYFQRSNSAMNEKFTEKYFDVIIVSNKIMDWVKLNLPSLTDYAEAMWIHSAYKTLERGYKSKNAKEQYKKEMSYLLKIVKSYSIYNVWKLLSIRQFVGFVLIRFSPNMYICVCRLMKI